MRQAVGRMARLTEHREPAGFELLAAFTREEVRLFYLQLHFKSFLATGVVIFLVGLVSFDIGFRWAWLYTVNGTLMCGIIAVPLLRNRRQFGAVKRRLLALEQGRAHLRVLRQLRYGSHGCFAAFVGAVIALSWLGMSAWMVVAVIVLGFVCIAGMELLIIWTAIRLKAIWKSPPPELTKA